MGEENDAKFYIWEGPYLSWAKACEVAQNYKPAEFGGPFTSSRWLERVRNQLLDYRKEYEAFGIALPPRQSNLPAITALVKPKKIVDLGGSSGWTYEYLKYSGLESAIDSYMIVENADIVQLMSSSGLHDSKVKFCTFEDKIQVCDILYCNSVLPYFETNFEFLRLVDQCDPEYILLDDLLARDGNDFFAIQRYYEQAMPHRFIGLDSLLNNLLSIGYELAYKVPCASLIMNKLMPVPMQNFPEEFRLRYSLSALFRKKLN